MAPNLKWLEADCIFSEKIMSRRSSRLVQQQTNEGVEATEVSRFSERRLSEEENVNSSNIQSSYQHISGDDIPETLLGIDLQHVLLSEAEAQNKSEERKSITLGKSFSSMEKLLYTMKTDINNIKSQIVTKESMRKMKSEIVKENEESMRKMKAEMRKIKSEIVKETEEAMRKVLREELQGLIKKEVSECMRTNLFRAAESCVSATSE